VATPAAAPEPPPLLLANPAAAAPCQDAAGRSGSVLNAPALPLLSGSRVAAARALSLWWGRLWLSAARWALAPALAPAAPPVRPPTLLPIIAIR
jgi:hypothetical protein